MSQNKKVIFKSYVGKGNHPTKEHFGIIECPNPPLKDGEIRLQTLYLSVDPYMRFRMNQSGDVTKSNPYVPGEPLLGMGVGRVIESKNPTYHVGDMLTTQKKLEYPYELYVVFDAQKAADYPKLDPKLPKHLISATIGWLGMPGLTAYFGMTDVARPKEGETLVISSAAGACGSIAGQIGKIFKCKVIGIVGSEDKVKYIKGLGFDGAIIYKNKTREQLSAEIAFHCPKGVDIYYDNVGGLVSEAVLLHMNKNGRVPICGQISQYNSHEVAPLPKEIQSQLDEKKIERGWFMVMNYHDKFSAGYKQLVQWEEEHRLTCNETTYDGIENVPTAFLSLFTGDTIGKPVVRVCH